MKRMDEDEVYERISDRVVEECGRRGINGVFAMADRFHRIRYTYVLLNNLVRLDKDDGLRYNLLCCVLSKIGIVLSYRRNSGGDSCVGEVPFMGGRLSKDGEFAYAFSGASQEEDDDLMQFAEQFHASL
jgi:hypothetical protein